MKGIFNKTLGIKRSDGTKLDPYEEAALRRGEIFTPKSPIINSDSSFQKEGSSVSNMSNASSASVTGGKDPSSRKDKRGSKDKAKSKLKLKSSDKTKTSAQSVGSESGFPVAGSPETLGLGDMGTARHPVKLSSEYQINVKYDQSLYDDDNSDYIVIPGDVFRGQYIFERVVGEGSFGKVIRAYDAIRKKLVAIKIIKSAKLYYQQALIEMKMVRYINRMDPDDQYRTLQVYEQFVYRGHLCLVTELLSVSLYDLLARENFKGLNFSLVRKFSREMLTCLEFLARPEVDVIHCDLKPENVLLVHPLHSNIKVVDFGSSCKSKDKAFTYIQSRFYRAPEIILGLPYSTQIDLWSLGCIMIELYTGNPIFPGNDELDQMVLIAECLGIPEKELIQAGNKSELFFIKKGGEYALRPGIGSREVVPGTNPIIKFIDDMCQMTAKRYDPKDPDFIAFLELVHKMLEYNPEKRIKPSEALTHPFITGEYAGKEKGGANMAPLEGENIEEFIKNQAKEGRVINKGRQAPKMNTNQEAKEQLEAELGEDAEEEEEESEDDEADGEGDTQMNSQVSEEETGGTDRGTDGRYIITSKNNQPNLLLDKDWAEKWGIEPPPWTSGAVQKMFTHPPPRPPSIVAKEINLVFRNIFFGEVPTCKLPRKPVVVPALHIPVEMANSRVYNLHIRDPIKRALEKTKDKEKESRDFGRLPFQSQSDFDRLVVNPRIKRTIRTIPGCRGHGYRIAVYQEVGLPKKKKAMPNVSSSSSNVGVKRQTFSENHSKFFRTMSIKSPLTMDLNMPTGKSSAAVPPSPSIKFASPGVSDAPSSGLNSSFTMSNSMAGPTPPLPPSSSSAVASPSPGGTPEK